jgi:dihydrofolate reductase
MGKLILCEHVSLDGFVAGQKGEMNWINVDDEIFDIAGKLTDEAGTALYGRVTYGMMESYWPTAADNPKASKHDIQHSQWYNNVFKVVISKSLKGRDTEKMKVISDDIPRQITELKKESGKNIIIFGSPSVCHSLMENDLIDEFWLFVNPVLLGEGIPLFKNIDGTVNLKLIESEIFSSGVAGLHYEKK